MNTLILGVRVLLFVLSTFGYLTLLHQRVHVKIEFLPAVVFAGQICILFLGGLLNLLPLTVLCLFLGGIILALFSWKNRKFYRDFLCPGYIFYVVSCLYFFFLFKGQVFSSYDNFSHWALVVKQMLLTDRFPNFQDEIILFQSSPLGSFVFIYYVSKIVSTSSEGCRMSAQTMLSLSMILPLFTSLRIQSGRQAEKQKIAGILLVLGASSFLLSYNNWPTELLVDALLPLTGAAFTGRRAVTGKKDYASLPSSGCFCHTDQKFWYFLLGLNGPQDYVLLDSQSENCRHKRKAVLGQSGTPAALCSASVEKTCGICLPLRHDCSAQHVLRCLCLQYSRQIQQRCPLTDSKCLYRKSCVWARLSLSSADSPSGVSYPVETEPASLGKNSALHNSCLYCLPAGESWYVLFLHACRRGSGYGRI